MRLAASPFFGIALSAVCFETGVIINKKTRSPFTNPLLIGIVLCILTLKLFSVPTELYKEGGDVISIMLAPVTACLAVSVYGQLDALRKNILPILAGTAAGSVSAAASAYILCRAFQLDSSLTASLLPKSVTTPIAIELCEQLGGNTSVTVAAVIYSGIITAILSPVLIRIFAIKNPIARGVAIGTSGHAMGTAAAFTIGETEGAMSGLSICAAGIFTVIITMLLQFLHLP